MLSAMYARIKMAHSLLFLLVCMSAVSLCIAELTLGHHLGALLLCTLMSLFVSIYGYMDFVRLASSEE